MHHINVISTAIHEEMIQSLKDRQKGEADLWLNPEGKKVMSIPPHFLEQTILRIVTSRTNEHSIIP